MRTLVACSFYVSAGFADSVPSCVQLRRHGCVSMIYATLEISSDALRAFILAQRISFPIWGVFSRKLLAYDTSLTVIASSASAKSRSVSLIIPNEGTRNHRPEDSASPAAIAQNAETHQCHALALRSQSENRSCGKENTV